MAAAYLVSNVMDRNVMHACRVTFEQSVDVGTGVPRQQKQKINKKYLNTITRALKAFLTTELDKKTFLNPYSSRCFPV